MATKNEKTAKKKSAKTEAAQAPKEEQKVKAASRPASPAVSEAEDRVMQHLRTHGKSFVGKVTSDKMHKTVVVQWERRRLLRKYERFEKRHSRVYAHNPPSINAKLGDIVRVQETRPLSKTKNFVVVEILRGADQ
jgi:small subunit ribosomal protein S17